MRNMSFALTTGQIRDRLKTVTRRKGWSGLRTGSLIRAVVKAMGLKPGEQVEPLATLVVTSVRSEPLHAITDEDVEREGFIMPAHEFIEMFCDHMGGDRWQIVNRIEFRYLPGDRYCRGDGGKYVCQCECGGDVRGVMQFGQLWTWCERCTPVEKVTFLR